MGGYKSAPRMSDIKTLKDRVELLETHIDNLDQQFATMSVGYLEQAVMIEALIERLDPEQQQLFKEHVSVRRRDLIDTLKKTGENVLSGDGQPG